jgi:hypothetical protein
MANMSFKNQIIFLFLFLAALSASLFSQEDSETLPDDAINESNLPREDALSDDSIYVINSFVFNIDGLTRPSALVNKGDLIAGVEITGLSNLEKYVQDKTQLLYNERVLDSVSMEYFIGQLREDGKYPVDLIIYVKDTWNIVVLPRPMYSSNSGWDITIKARDYNFLGTMSPLRLDLGYKYDEEGRSSFLFMLDSNIPFRFLNLNWNFKFVNDFSYRPDVRLPFYYKNTTGLSAEFPLGQTVITAGFNEDLYLNEENPDSDKYLYGEFQEGLFMSSSPYISWKIPFGVEIGEWGELVYTPKIQAVFNHEFSEWPLNENRKGPFLTFNHSLGFARVDWVDNFLRGFDIEIYNSNNIDFFKMKNPGQEPFSAYIRVSGIGHFIIADFFGVSTRLMYRQWFLYDKGYEDAGDVLRGILDRDIRADYMFSLNLDLPFKVLRFKPSNWFNNQKLKLFDFDLHLIPIFDAAVFHDPVDKTAFDSENFLFSGGIEAIVFPDFFRSLFLRISLGFNLSDLQEKNNYEIFFGTDLHY